MFARAIELHVRDEDAASPMAKVTLRKALLALDGCGRGRQAPRGRSGARLAAAGKRARGDEISAPLELRAADRALESREEEDMSSTAYPGTLTPSSMDGSPSPAGSAAAPAPPPAFLAHLADYFDANRDRRITVAETFSGLRKLGLPIALAAPATVAIHVGMIGIGLASSRLIDPLALHLPLAGRVRHASDTRIIDANGDYDPRRVDEIFEKYGQGDTITAGGLSKLIADDVSRSARSTSEASPLPRWVGVPFGASASIGELGLLYLIASRKERGRRVLDKGTIYRFYNDPLFFDSVADRLAAERAARGQTLLGRGENLLRKWLV